MNTKNALSILLAVAAPSVFAQINFGRSEFTLADASFVGPFRMDGKANWAPFVMASWNDKRSNAMGLGVVYKTFGNGGGGKDDFSLIFSGSNNTPTGGTGTQTDLAIAGWQVDDNTANLIRSFHFTYVEGAGQVHAFVPSFTVAKNGLLGGHGLMLNGALTGSYVYGSTGHSGYSSDASLSTMLGPITLEGDYTIPSPGNVYDYYVQATTSLIKQTALKVKYDKAHSILVTFGFRF